MLEVLFSLWMFVLAGLGVADQCQVSSESESMMPMPCPPEDSTDQDGSNIVKGGGSGLIKAGGAG